MARAMIFGAILTCAAVLGAAEIREWSDRSGKYKIEAQLVAVKDGKVYLEKADGTVTPVELSKLSPADIEYLQSLPEHKAYFEKSPVAAEPGGADGGAARPRFKPIRTLDEIKSGEVRRFSDLKWQSKSVAFSADGGLLAVGRLDNALSVFNIDKSSLTATFERLEGLGQVTCLAFTPDGKKLLSGGYTGRIQVWDVGPSGQLTEANRFVGHSREILAIRVGSDGKTVLSGGGEKKVRAWDLETGRERFAIDGFEGEVKDVFISRTGKQGLAADGAILALIDMAQGKVVQTMKLVNTAAHAVAIAPGGGLVAVSETYAIRLLDVRSGRELPLLQDREIQWSLRFLPGGKHLLAGGGGKVSLWEIAGRRKIGEFDTGGGYAQVLAASPDDRHFAAGALSSGYQMVVFRMPPEVAE